MKNTLIVILTLIRLLTFGQVNNLDQIDNQVNLIESDSTLKKSELSLDKLTGITTDGGGFLKTWRSKEQACKIVEEIGFSYGRIRIMIYLENGIPIKIIETEENFGYKNGELNYKELNEVYREIIYVLDWEKDNTKIKRIGKRNMSEASCSIFELVEPILERVNK